MSEEITCAECNDTGVVENTCHCAGMSIDYSCPSCGNCGIIEVACPECNDDPEEAW